MLTLNTLRKYNRLQATAAHFILSLIIFAILGYLVYFCWYPQPLFSIDAGWQGMRILAFVDFVLGPCLTLVIFNPKKKELFKDVLVIALIQFSALSYGVYHVYQSRPAIVVYADNTIYTVALSELEHFNLSDQLLNEINISGPVYKFMELPRDKHTVEYAVETDDFINYEKLQDIRFESVGTETPFFLLENHLKPYFDNIATINQYSFDLDKVLKELSQEDQDTLTRWMKSNPDYQNYSYTTVKGRFSSAIVQISSESGKFQNFIEVTYEKNYL